MKELYSFLMELGLEGELKECVIKEDSICERKQFRRKKKKLRELNPRDLLAQRASFFRIYTSLTKEERSNLL